MPATYRLSYYPWLTQNVPAAEIHREIERFAREVEKQLSGITIQVLPTLEVGPQIDLLLAGVLRDLLTISLPARMALSAVTGSAATAPTSPVRRLAKLRTRPPSCARSRSAIDFRASQR